MEHLPLKPQVSSTGGPCCFSPSPALFPFPLGAYFPPASQRDAHPGHVAASVWLSLSLLITWTHGQPSAHSSHMHGKPGPKQRRPGIAPPQRTKRPYIILLLNIRESEDRYSHLAFHLCQCMGQCNFNLTPSPKTCWCEINSVWIFICGEMCLPLRYGHSSTAFKN